MRHRRWTLRQWSRIIWSDEKCFVIDKKDGRIRCYRRKNERFLPPNIHQYGPRKSIMVWAAISAEGKSEMIRFQGNVTARRYREEALEPGLLPFLNTHQANQMQYMQDNAPRHHAYATRDWFQDNNVTLFSPWPSKSPDMNPIENLWAQMETALNRRVNRPTNECQQERSGQTLTCLTSDALSFPCADGARLLCRLRATTPATDFCQSLKKHHY